MTKMKWTTKKTLVALSGASQYFCRNRIAKMAGYPTNWNQISGTSLI